MGVIRIAVASAVVFLAFSSCGSNETSERRRLNPPELALGAGTYSYGTRVGLGPAADASIVYTLDGSEPGPKSRRYTGPIPLDSDHTRDGVMKLRAARLSDSQASEVAAADYRIAPGLVVHFRKPSSWSSAYVHYWNTLPDQRATAWPGVPMTHEGGGWYVATVPAQRAAGLVFNDQGKQQTADLRRDREGWFAEDEWYDRHPDHATRFAFPGGKRKALIVSMDDNHDADRKLVALMNQHGIVGTFHVNSGKLDQPPFLTSAEIATLFAGHEVSTHGVTHPFLTDLDVAGIEAELLPDRAALSALSGQDVRGHAYPFGAFDDEVVEVLRAHDFAYARVVPHTNDFRLPGDLFRWRASCHQSCAGALVEPFLQARPSQPLLFFIWGHSWELDKDEPQNNWQHMEWMLEELGGRADIWYTTALEMSDYVRAINRVRPALDRDELENLGASPVWLLSADGSSTLLAP